MANAGYQILRSVNGNEFTTALNPYSTTFNGFAVSPLNATVTKTCVTGVGFEDPASGISVTQRIP